MYVHMQWPAGRCQKRVSNAPETKLQIVVHHLSVGKQTQAFCESN